MSSLVSKLSPESRAVPPSGIVEVFTYGWGRPGLIPLWAGEGDLPTPTFITEATTRSLAAGETFYTPNRGIPAFREAVARHMGHIYEREFSPDNFLCTIGGMHALQIAMRMVLSENDEVIIPSPAWPNFAGAAIAVGAQTIDVPMGKQGQGKHARWHLDLDVVKKHLTPKTRAIIINSPSNPTGWTATRDELRMIRLCSSRHSRKIGR